MNRFSYIVVVGFFWGHLPAMSAPWQQWIEPDAPFFSTVVDARGYGITDNLAPRALVFPLGNNVYLAYDLDLLRVMAVWQADGDPFADAGMAVNSYPYQLKKVGGGQGRLPKPKGALWFQTGRYPGVGVEGVLPDLFVDPRPPNINPDEVGRGGLDPGFVRFRMLNVWPAVKLEYYLDGDVQVFENFALNARGLTRRFRVAPHEKPLYVVLAEKKVRCLLAGRAAIEQRDERMLCVIPPSDQPETIEVTFLKAMTALSGRSVSGKRWPDAVRLSMPSEKTAGAFLLEHLPLPVENPWNRAVRNAGIDFFNDGRIAMVTFDGDVWLGDGCAGNKITWTRFASGLHEPLSIKVHHETMYVFDRNGVWRLRDQNNDGEADGHELFSAMFDQTAETREFVESIAVEQDGSVVVSRGGQQRSSRTAGAIIRIAPDGDSFETIAEGFRHPFFGYDPVSGAMACTDQQGNFVPSTPVHFIRKGDYGGHPVAKADEGRPITPPLTWVPHQVCGSAMDVVWWQENPVLLSYNPPRILQLHLDMDEFARQGGATAFDLPLAELPILKGAVNPIDNALYLSGFRIWGTVARQNSFLARVRRNPEQVRSLPIEVRAERRGVLLRFETPLGDAAVSPASYTVRRWNYQRSNSYGSANYKLDGSKGVDELIVASVAVSKDRRAVFLGVRDMQEAMQIEVVYRIASRNGVEINRQTHLTAHLLRNFDLTDYGFADNNIDLQENDGAIAVRAIQPTIEKGAQLYTLLGCVACHSIDGSHEGKTGPSWWRLFGSERKILGSGITVKADEAYLRESILDPEAKVAEGAVNGEAGMPIYNGVLNEEQIQSLLLYIKSLADL